MKPALLIVGASYAGAQIAAGARAGGYDGRIVLLGDEPRAPYQRPPLSKGLLTGKTAGDALALKAEAFYRDADIELLTGRRAERLDVSGRRVALDDGTVLGYDRLALATGARCRALAVPGAALEGVMTLRTLDDALRLDAAARGARSACVIGGGFIGLEVASALVSRGLRVSVVEAQPLPMARAVAAPVARFFEQLHRERGVQWHGASSVGRLVGDAGGRVAAVELGDGRRIECELVVAGIGVLPNVELAADAGLACDDGVRVDALGRTSAPGVFAAGDCASFPNPYAAQPGRPTRLESIQAANDLSRAVASALVGRPQPYAAVPWFWSDQYESKLQMAGLAAPGDELVQRGRAEDGRFSVFHLREGRVAATHSVNRPAEHLLSRKLIAGRCRASAAQLADESFDLKSLLSEEGAMAP